MFTIIIMDQLINKSISDLGKSTSIHLFRMERSTVVGTVEYMKYLNETILQSHLSVTFTYVMYAVQYATNNRFSC